MSLLANRHYNANSRFLSSSLTWHPRMRPNSPSPVTSLAASANTTATAYLSVSGVSAFAVLTNILHAHNDKVGGTHTYSISCEGKDCVSDISSPYSPTSSKSPASSISSATSVGSVQDQLQTAKQQPLPSLPDTILFPSSGTRYNTSTSSSSCKIRCDEGAPIVHKHCRLDSLRYRQARTATSPTPLLFNTGFDSDPCLDKNSQAPRGSPSISSIKRHEPLSSIRICARTTPPSTIRATRKSFSIARLPQRPTSCRPSERVTNINGDYDARLLTPSALRNAQERSETIKMAAQMRAAELKKNSGGLDFSTGPFSREYVRGRGPPSPLRASWVPNEFQARTSVCEGEGLMAAEAPSSPLDADAAFRELLSKPIDLAAYWSKGR